ncbi:hypothetical protein ONS95_002721 [Cadophora gregata]|uniref:uncharacterized protein n=1 Tax=Cadophora gregata TaxID=51156 RepID=UPI0026DC9F99|nr:uncharacterized protein ONS95_002721 [Cadophora gregata]KAK0110064.1 hypothetical protein ONS95_002721 [Cadophora gregata]
MALIASTLVPAFILLFVPAFLGASISYTTPIVGLGCRSLTLLVYACAQAILIILWLLKWTLWGTMGRSKKIFERSELFLGLANASWYFVFFIGSFASFVTGIMGTVFVLMSLYANCLCSTPVSNVLQVSVAV